MQTSVVFDQRTWPGAGDVDDCAVVSALQALNVTSPWLHLVGVPAFRAAAGNPDDPAQPDGLVLGQVVRGLEGCYPQLRGHLRVMHHDSWSSLVGVVRLGHPVSVAIVSGKLPAVLRFGFLGRHQVTLAWAGGQLRLANPLQRAQSRWLRVTWSAVQPAILAYGKLRTGSPCVYAVGLPTDAEARAMLGMATDDTPFDQADLDAATADLQARIDAALADLAPDPES